MQSAPGISIREVFDRASEEALKPVIGSNTLDVLSVMNPELLTRENLTKLALQSAEPWEMLRDRESREHIISLLPLGKAEELAAKLGLAAKGARVYDVVGAALSDQRLERVLFEFFGVVVPERAPGAEAPSEKIITPDYPLFPHQLGVSDRASVALSEHPYKVLVHMPTGAGKTRTAMHVVCEVHNRRRDRLVVWLAQSSELLEQAASEFERAWSALGRSPANVVRYWGTYDPDLAGARSGVLVAGFAKLHALYQRHQNMIMRIGDRAVLTVVDEAHQAIAPTYRSLISFIAGKRPGNALLGLTATPGRSWADIAKDTELSAFFDNRKVTIEVEGYDNPVDFLIDRGFLARPTFRVLEVESSACATAAKAARDGEDVSPEVLECLTDDRARNVEIIKVIEALAERHKRIIVFAAGVRHAHLISSVLTLRGLNSSVVTAFTDQLSRERALRRFRGSASEPRVICNFGVLTTGFDAPNTSAAVIARPTRSLVLYSQMVGRAIRGPAAGGNASAEIVTVADTKLPGFGSVADAFVNWEDVWGDGRTT